MRSFCGWSIHNKQISVAQNCLFAESLWLLKLQKPAYVIATSCPTCMESTTQLLSNTHRKEFTLHFYVYKMLSKLHCLINKIHCLTNQNKPDNGQRHRVSLREGPSGGIPPCVYENSFIEFITFYEFTLNILVWSIYKWPSIIKSNDKLLHTKTSSQSFRQSDCACIRYMSFLIGTHYKHRKPG